MYEVGTGAENQIGRLDEQGRFTEGGTSRVQRPITIVLSTRPPGLRIVGRLASLAAGLLHHPGRTEALRKWAIGIATRRGKRIAVTALARRMAGVLFAMMRDHTRYIPAAVPEPPVQAA